MSLYAISKLRDVPPANWTPSSWQSFPIKQQPEYPDKAALAAALQRVKNLPPLVHPKEVLNLKHQLAQVIEGKMFLLQGGDCAERFQDCNKTAIENKFKIILQMSLILTFVAKVPVVKVARMAGQFAKPRSSANETINGQSYPSFKGDNVNSFDLSHRAPDPDRLVQAYWHSVATLNWLRAMIAGGVADLHSASHWKLHHVLREEVRREYEAVISKIVEGFDFLKAIHADSADTFRTVDFFTSHEGLLLNYEEALTTKIGERYFNLGAHFLWIGDRTRALDGAHVEYFRGICNPIGVKVGPTTQPEELAKLVAVLNPNKEPGRLTLVTRYGHDKVGSLLPAHIAAVRATGIPVVWCCDPCHGNTEVTENGIKTRRFEKIVAEVVASIDYHRKEGSHLGGLHLELTGEDVTECVGGSPQLEPSHLSRAYETFCDPRLNYTQSLDIAFTVAKTLERLLSRDQHQYIDWPADEHISQDV